MKRLGKKELLADGLLLLTALIWGSAFAVVKNTLDSFPPAAIIAMRYTIATALTGIAFRKHLRALTREDILRGALVACCSAQRISCRRSACPTPRRARTPS